MLEPDGHGFEPNFGPSAIGSAFDRGFKPSSEHEASGSLRNPRLEPPIVDRRFQSLDRGFEVGPGPKGDSFDDNSNANFVANRENQGSTPGFNSNRFDQRATQN